MTFAEVAALVVIAGAFVGYRWAIGRRIARLERIRTRFEQIWSSGIVGVLIAEIGGPIVEANATLLKMLGYTEADVRSRSLTSDMLTPLEWRNTDQAVRDYLIETPGSIPAREKEFFHADGTRVPIILSVTALEKPYALGMVIDLTSQKAERRFRELVEAGPDPVVIVDGKNNIVLVNKRTEELFGYGREELVGQPGSMLVPERLRDFATAAGARAAGELYGLRKDGTEVAVEISLSPVGSLVTVAIRDVTERKLLDARILEASRLKSEFLANMSHELRTPLNAILGFAELIHSGRVGPVPPEQHEYIGDILTSGRHLLQMVNDVLDLAKIESGKQALDKQPARVQQLVEETQAVVRGLATAKHLQMHTEIDPDVEQVSVDPARVKQLLFNYLSNAIKFTGEGGTITLRVRPADDPKEFRIDVTDTGIGIAPDDVPKLFVDFQQLDGGSGKRYQGTGLGLALAKRIVEGHGGRVEVSSVLGSGSTFSAILPRA